MQRFIEVHMFRNFPFSRPNADDTGEQKTAIFGGVRRSRISSQASKRPVREWQRNHLTAKRVYDLVGIRSSFIYGEIINRCKKFTDAEDLQQRVAKAIVNKCFDVKFSGKATTKAKAGKKSEEQQEEVAIPPKTGYLIFTSHKEIDSLLEVAFTQIKNEVEPESLVFDKKKMVTTTLDVALSGRMQANATDFEIRGALRIAHSIGVNALVEEFDYFTAVDDLKNDDNEENGSGAGFIQSLSANSSLYYSYADICVDKLVENLGGDVELAKSGIIDWLSGFIMSTPTGKQASFATNVVPSFVMIKIHNGQAVNLIDAFETPIKPSGDRSVSDNAVTALLSFDNALRANFGDLLPSGDTLIYAKQDLQKLLGEDAPKQMSIAEILNQLPKLI